MFSFIGKKTECYFADTNQFLSVFAPCIDSRRKFRDHLNMVLGLKTSSCEMWDQYDHKELNGDHQLLN